MRNSFGVGEILESQFGGGGGMDNEESGGWKRRRERHVGQMSRGGVLWNTFIAYGP